MPAAELLADCSGCWSEGATVSPESEKGSFGDPFGNLRCCSWRRGRARRDERAQPSLMETLNSCTGLHGDLEVQDRNEKFLYFAYGSNLLQERIKLGNPSVVFFTVARLPDYKLAFGSHQGKPSALWNGGTATIVYTPGEEVWGIIWKMNTADLCFLDRQEGVEDGFYIPIEVTVQTVEGKVVKCRSYQMDDYVHDLPSPQYKKVICMGAKQNGLPMDYQKKLDSINVNDFAGPVPLFEEIKAMHQKNKLIKQ